MRDGNYTLAVIAGGSEIDFAVLPEKIEVSSNGLSEKINVMGLGEVLVLKGNSLRRVSWEGFLTDCDAPYVTGKRQSPIAAVRALQAATASSQPVRLILSGTDLDVNLQMGVESFSYNERFGATGDIYYKIVLVEWKNHSATKLSASYNTTSASGTYISSSSSQRSGDTMNYISRTVAIGGAPITSGQSRMVSVGSITVVKGDCLWDLARRYLGDGLKYETLYRMNASTIDSRNRSTGNSKYTIYPGQVLRIG